MPGKSQKRRLELLGTAGTAMALIVAGSTVGASIAAAATTNSSEASASANKTAISQSTNSAAVSASINDSLGGVSTNSSSGSSNTHAATGNDVLAAATGNAFHNQIDLSIIDTNGSADGSAALGMAVNLPGALITSEVTGNEVSVDLIDFSNGSAVNEVTRSARQRPPTKAPRC